jgi:uncharacterized membrane protein YbhN (UPF0104 family)
MALMILLCAAMVLAPGPMLGLANRILRRLSRPTIDFRLDKSVALQILGGYVVGWVFYGVAFWLMLTALAPQTAPGLVAAAGIYCIAYQVGYLTIFAPGGIGTRELVMTALLAPFLGPLAPMTAIAARLWSIVIDSVATLIALRIKL